MREIKFRGLSLYDEKRWVYGLLFKSGSEGQWTEIQMENGATCYVDPETVGQFTGCKDKNGVEICEGDVYHQGDTNITYTVVWHDTGLIGKQNGSSSYAGLSHWRERIEIIGNIYEHSHLLEAAE